ncbi:MAG: protocatechuate 4,5-dioxygenase subunit alpha [Nitratireductor sp.]|jgi:protocatechuate 4,5-dioxygenase alpha chain|nr:protocatechuate 4,5-dioxygenase subunit alpha [Nitratireductor sp.]MCC0020900.1 protocatechuate 4,5-dioxygenase subunit alpha [Nitratireductor sp.]
MDAPAFDHHVHIPGTTVFDGKQAMKGYALNKMCYSFNKKENRDAFAADEEGFMEKYGLNDEQKDAIRKRDVLAMIAAGGNIYYLAKLAGIFKLSVQDVGGLQTGRTTEEFKEFLKSQA